MIPKVTVNDLYECERFPGGWRIRHNEGDSVQTVTDEMHSDVIKAIRRIVKDEIDDFGHIPAKAIMNSLEHVSEDFRKEQDEWKKENSNLRNTGCYTPRYYNVLHVMRYDELIEYWKTGLIDILDEEKVLNTELIKIVRKKVPTLKDWLM